MPLKLARVNLGPRLVAHFKQLFEHFKHTYIHFYTLFHPHLYQKHLNNITQTTLPNTSLVSFSIKRGALMF